MDNSKQKQCILICSLLGSLGAINCLIIACYILTSFTFLPMEQLLLEAYLAAGLMTISAITIICGSYLIFKKDTLKGGTINLLAGTLIPVPVCTYFAVFSQRTLSWLGSLGIFLLAPAVISGTISILIHKKK